MWSRVNAVGQFSSHVFEHVNTFGRGTQGVPSNEQQNFWNSEQSEAKCSQNPPQRSQQSQKNTSKEEWFGSKSICCFSLHCSHCVFKDVSGTSIFRIFVSSETPIGWLGNAHIPWRCKQTSQRGQTTKDKGKHKKVRTRFFFLCWLCCSLWGRRHVLYAVEPWHDIRF